MRYLEVTSYSGTKRVIVGGHKAYMEFMEKTAASGFVSIKQLDVLSREGISLLVPQKETISLIGEFDSYEKEVLEGLR